MRERSGYITIANKIILVVVFGVLLFGIIAFARGYRLDIQRGKVTSTGIIAVTSSPSAAQVYLNGQLAGVTDTHLTLPHGEYHVEVRKEGYRTWQKTIVLKGELVQTADATLFPLNPSLTPLTTIGISHIVSIDQTDKALIFVENGDVTKDGIYIFDETAKPFSLFPPLKMLASKKLFPSDISIVPTNVIFSPDYKQAIIALKRGEDTVSYLLSMDTESTQLFEVTSSQDSLTQAWDAERAKEEARLLEVFPQQFQKIASDSFKILSVSPDKTHILYTAKQAIALPIVIQPRLLGANQTPEERNLTAGNLYVYDRKEDRNYHIVGGDAVVWFADSDHLVVSAKHVFEIMDYDGTNRQVAYSGPHVGDYFDITADGKLLILANFNPDFNKFPDLYAVGIR